MNRAGMLLALQMGAIGILFAFSLPLSGTLVVEAPAKDIFVPLSAAWAVRSGLLPHIDFWTPIGPAYAWQQAWMPWLLGTNAPVLIVWANYPVALFSSFVALVLARGRLPGAVSFAFAVLVCLVALSPRLIDGQGAILSHLASYNRAGWALCAALLPLLCGGPALRRRDLTLAGLIVLWAGLLKISFVPLAFLLVLLGLPRWRLLPLFLLPPVGGLAVLAAAGMAIPYLHQVMEAAAAGGDAARLERLAHMLHANALPLLAAGIVGAACWRREGMGSSGVRLAVGLLLCVAAGLQAHDYAVPAAWIGLLPLCALAARDAQARTPAGVFGLLLAAPMWWNDLSALLLHRFLAAEKTVPALGEQAPQGMVSWEILDAHGRPSGLAFRGASVRAHPSVVEARTLDERPFFYDVGEEAAALSEAAQALGRLLRPGDRVLDLGFANPWGLLAGVAPPRGMPLWLHEGRTVSERWSPPLATIAADADLLVLPEGSRLTIREAWTIRHYFAEVEAGWVRIGGTSDYSFWRRASMGSP
jgi:hypothetical protein